MRSEESDNKCTILFAGVERSAAFEANAHRHLDLFDPQIARERILAAELFREMGEFDEAVAMLKGSADIIKATYQFEYEKSRLAQNEARKRWSGDDFYGSTPHAEDLAAIAAQIEQHCAETDQLVRPVAIRRKGGAGSAVAR